MGNADELKPCRLCGQAKPLEAYYRAPGMRDGRRSECKACFAAQSKRRYERDPEAVKRRVRAWQRANPERYAAQQAKWRKSGGKAASGRRSHLRRTFALDEAGYVDLLQSQGGRCAICRSLPAEGKNLDVDHDHRTGEVRGCLCRQCNHGLGLFRDDLLSLMTAIEYLTGAQLAAELTFLPPEG